MNNIVVKKWGGENSAELKGSNSNIIIDYLAGKKQIVVLSAIRSPDFNTTDNLIKLGELLGNTSNLSLIYKQVDIIKDFHIGIINEKLPENNDIIINITNEYFVEFKNHIQNFINDSDKNLPSIKNDFLLKTKEKNISVLGFGEDLAAYIHNSLLNSSTIDGLKSEIVDLNGVADGIKEEETDQEIFEKLSENILKKVENILGNNSIPIIPGYIPGFTNGIESVIGRGYTDATAALVSVGSAKQNNVVLEIQKSVEGMLSADPRIVGNNKTKLIKQINYLTAKEITGARGAQAKLLHSQVLRTELQNAGIKVKLFNPFDNSKGTIISKEKNNKSSGVEFIGGREGIVFFTVSSGNMSSEGILSGVFSIVKKYASVDIISTSETEISFTIDSGLKKETLDEIVIEIEEKLDMKDDQYENFVRYELNKALVFCVGQNLHHSKGSLWKAAGALTEANINIQMVSQGTMERAMIFGINESELNDSIKILHKEFIEE